MSGTGAGIGLAVAQGYAEAGANVALWYHTNAKANERAAEIEKKYGVKCTSEYVFCAHCKDTWLTEVHVVDRQGIPSQHQGS